MNSKFSDTAAKSEYDAVVVGSRSNVLATAIELARQDWKVLVVEGNLVLPPLAGK